MESYEIYLSVIIPCYNEEANLRRGALDEVRTFLAKQHYKSEVIVVDDGSTDNSLYLIRSYASQELNFKAISISHRGKPAAIWEGVKQAKGEIVLFADMDQSTPIWELEKILPWYELGFQAVIGSRGIQRKGFSALRRIGSFVFRTLRRLLLLWNVIDTQCGFKSFKRIVALKAFPQLSAIKQQSETAGWKVTAFDVELLYILELMGYKIKEVGIDWVNRDISKTKTQESSSRQYFRESVEMLEEIIRIRVNKLRTNHSEKND